MTTYLFIDTETTGFKRGGSLIQPKQARVCQIAMIWSDESGKSLMEYQSLIKPENWDTDGKTHNFFGISYDDCAKYGVAQNTIIDIFTSISSNDNVQIVAHNSDFDKGMMEVENEYYREKRVGCPSISQNWYCTMKRNTHISPNGKWPKLDATLKHYTGKELIDAHDAMADTKACRDIFFAMNGIKT